MDVSARGSVSCTGHLQPRSPREDSIAPGRHSLLRRRVIASAANVVLERRHKLDRRLVESVETKPRFFGGVKLEMFYLTSEEGKADLVKLEEIGKLAGSYLGASGFVVLVDAIVEIAKPNHAAASTVTTHNGDAKSKHLSCSRMEYVSFSRGITPAAGATLTLSRLLPNATHATHEWRASNPGQGS